MLFFAPFVLLLHTAVRQLLFTIITSKYPLHNRCFGSY